MIGTSEVISKTLQLMSIQGQELNNNELESDLKQMNSHSPLKADNSSESDDIAGAFSVSQSARSPDVKDLISDFNTTVQKSYTRG